MEINKSKNTISQLKDLYNRYINNNNYNQRIVFIKARSDKYMAELIDMCCKINNITRSEFIRRACLEKVKKHYDYQVWKEKSEKRN